MKSTERSTKAKSAHIRLALGPTSIAGLLAALMLFGGAWPAAADNDWASARGAVACRWMDLHPNLYGALSTMRTMEDEGVSRPEVPRVLGEVISTYCPRRADLYQQVKDYLTHMGNPGIIGVG